MVVVEVLFTRVDISSSELIFLLLAIVNNESLPNGYSKQTRSHGAWELTHEML